MHDLPEPTDRLATTTHPVRGTGAVIAGAAALTTGVALAGAHLAKAGLTATAWIGLALAVGGAVLLGVVVTRGIRRHHGWRRVFVPAGALLALFTTAQLVAIPVLVTNVPPTAVGEQTPADHGFDYADVTFPAADGTELSAWFIPPHNGAVAVLLHGSGSTRTAVLDHAAVLARHGYGALLLDARGHGQSGGTAMDLGWSGDEDIAAAIDWLLAQPWSAAPPAVALVGLSMGGEEAIGAAASDRRIRAVVAEGATGRVAADRAWFSDAYGVRGAVQELFEHGQEAVTDMLTEASPPPSLRSAAADSATPMLLIAAGEMGDEERAAAHIRGGSPETVEVWVVPGGGHVEALDTDPSSWENRVVGFLDAALAG